MSLSSSVDSGRGSAVGRPRSVELRDALLDLITAQGLVPGDRLPSEVELAEVLGVGRGTVRVVLKVLEADGVIDVRHGRGNFVSALGGVSVSSPVTKLESVTEMLEARGLKLTTRVLSVERSLPTAQEAEDLRDRASSTTSSACGACGWVTESCWSSRPMSFPPTCSGEPIPTRWISDSLTSWMPSAGRGPVSSAAHMRTAQLPADVAARPEVRAGTTWLLISELCVDHTGAPVLVYEGLPRGDVYSVQFVAVTNMKPRQQDVGAGAGAPSAGKESLYFSGAKIDDHLRAFLSDQGESCTELGRRRWSNQPSVPRRQRGVTGHRADGKYARLGARDPDRCRPVLRARVAQAAAAAEGLAGLAGFLIR